MTDTMKILRANIMGGMNSYLEMQEDDDIWELWIEVFPDGCSEDELMEMADNDAVWFDVIDRFAYCCRQMGVIE